MNHEEDRVQVFILLCSLSVLNFLVYKYVHPFIHAARFPAISRTGNIKKGKFSEPVLFYTSGNETKMLVLAGHQFKVSPSTQDTKQHLSAAQDLKDSTIHSEAHSLGSKGYYDNHKPQKAFIYASL